MIYPESCAELPTASCFSVIRPQNCLCVGGCGYTPLDYRNVSEIRAVIAARVQKR